jgi:hypothetical protein
MRKLKKEQNMWLLSRATASKNSNVLKFILPLREEQADEAWEPSSKMKLFLFPLALH